MIRGEGGEKEKKQEIEIKRIFIAEYKIINLYDIFIFYKLNKFL